MRVIEQGQQNNLSDTNHNFKLRRSLAIDQNSISLDQNISNKDYKLCGKKLSELKRKSLYGK
jgi:hypothetical protein